MEIAKKIRENQNVKEMTRRAIEAILAVNPMDPAGIELAEEFEAEYGESL